MNLSAPTQPVFIISLVLFLLALIAFLGVLPMLAGYSFWILVIAYAVLVIGNVATGL